MTPNKIIKGTQKNVMSFKDTVISHKKYTIIICVIFAVLLIGWIIAVVANSTLKENANELNTAISQYSNAIREERNNSLSFSNGVTRNNTNITYTGAIFDGQRWADDNNIA